MKTTVILVRHGETKWNRAKKLQGQTDIPLTQEGIHQAEALAAKLPQLTVQTIYSSVLQRAVKTATIIGDAIGIPVLQDPRFNERSFGDWEGKRWDQLEAVLKKEGKELRQLTPPNGESLAQFANRILSAFEEVINKHQHQTILIVCHAGVLHTLVRYLKNLPQEKELELTFPNTSLSIFHLEKDLIVEELVADASHLS